MPRKISKVILINSRPNDEEFVVPFCDEVLRNNVPLDVLDARELSFLYRRSERSVHVFNGEKEVTFESGTYVYLRRAWHAKKLQQICAWVCESLGVQQNDEAARLRSNISNSKLPQSFILRTIVSSPTTWVTGELGYRSGATQILKNFTFPLVFKMNGGNGSKVWKVDSREDLEVRLNNVWNTKNDVVLIQELIPNTFDIRVIVFQGEILASISRTAKKGAFHNNVSQGGSSELIELSEAERQIAIGVTEKLGLDLAGVDLVRHGDQTLLFEVNMSPGLINDVFNDKIVRKIVHSLITDRPS